MKKAIAIHMRIFWILYAIAYLVKSFTIWQFQNPFKWVIDLPTYTADDRGWILAGFIVLHVVIAILIWPLYYVTVEKK